MEALEDKIRTFLSITKVTDEEQSSDWSNGSGYGNGIGFGSAIGCGHESGEYNCNYSGKEYTLKGIAEYNNEPVYDIDGIPTIITSVRGNFATGYILRQDMTLKKCYIAKVGNCFAHGEDIHTAFKEAQDKAIKTDCDKCIQDYVSYVILRYPDVDALIPAKELFELHNIITGSCTLGRMEFIKENHIDLESSLSMRSFLNLVRFMPGKENIKKIAEAYHIELYN